MKLIRILCLTALTVCSAPLLADELRDSIQADYETYLWPLFDHFHRHPELSGAEIETAARMAQELTAAGFAVTEGVGGTGLVALLSNGEGPLVMMRADMDGLPVEEKADLSNVSRSRQMNPATGSESFTMHACGHDVHITSLVGTARQMMRRKDQWSGTLMLVVQPAEETGAGAKAMREDDIWGRFGKPDYALAFHVNAQTEAGKVDVTELSPYAGADSVDIIVHGVGAHGASPHASKDPIVLGSQIVLALQTLVARELPPKQPGVVTVGAFHAGSKHNIISDRAHLQLTVRNTNPETRELLLAGIERIAVNMGRVAGLPEDKLPEVIVSADSVPPTQNDPALARQLRNAWQTQLGDAAVTDNPAKGMGAEDFPFFTTDPSIRTVYWRVGGTSAEDLAIEAAGGAPVPTHHSPIFKIEPEASVTTGVESTVTALLELMPR